MVEANKTGGDGVPAGFDDQPRIDPANERPTQFPRTAADAVVVRQSATQEGKYEIMLITRKKQTFHGKLAFPGGHIDYNEDPEVACVRELEEECNVKGANPVLLTVKGKPGRDPRYHMISIVYLVEVDPSSEPTAQDDALSAAWYELGEVLKTPENFAFDHHEILLELCDKYPQNTTLSIK